MGLVDRTGRMAGILRTPLGIYFLLFLLFFYFTYFIYFYEG